MADRQWTTTAGTDKWYKLLCEQYTRVCAVYHTLRPEHREVIADISKQMGHGMARFIEMDVLTVKDYDLYCHYVAGLLGWGLSKMFLATRLEHGKLTEELSEHMGLFLQKTNIIRDYLEDINEEPAARMFWPKEIWGQYAQRLEDFKDPANEAAAVGCLNHLVEDALRHAPHSLEYLSRLEDQQIFRFCAIPQVMAIGTLALCYNNPQVFRGVVKLRRGQTALYMTSTTSMRAVYLAFAHFATTIVQKAQHSKQPSAGRAQPAAVRLRDACAEGLHMDPTELARRGKSLHAAAFPVPMAVLTVLFALVALVASVAMHYLSTALNARR